MTPSQSLFLFFLSVFYFCSLLALYRKKTLCAESSFPVEKTRFWGGERRLSICFFKQFLLLFWVLLGSAHGKRVTSSWHHHGNRRILHWIANSFLLLCLFSFSFPPTMPKLVMYPKGFSLRISSSAVVDDTKDYMLYYCCFLCTSLLLLI